MQQVTIRTLGEMKARGEKIAVLTCYDATFTHVVESAGVDVILVGDSLGMVMQGRESTLPVTLEEMVYHTACVARARQRSLLMADMPFLSYASVDRAIDTAAALIQRGGAQMVKLEGGGQQLAAVRALTENGVAVCAHLGLQPQSVHKLGGYRVQGRDQQQAERMLRDAMNAFARLDIDAAYDVVCEDERVDEEYDALTRQCITFMMEDPRSIRRFMNVTWVARSLERIGDHARNIAEHVIYLVHGMDVRHISPSEIEKQLEKQLYALVHQ